MEDPEEAGDGGWRGGQQELVELCQALVRLGAELRDELLKLLFHFGAVRMG
ncbi:MAG TPA: hypothetical protein QGF58_29445 [Myxococcota bacterium]|nr:hypothetical protein [Myxococcota bacterium]